MTKLNCNEDILFWAFRYALGRATYCTDDVQSCLAENWGKLSVATQNLIKREIMEADRLDTIGMEMDRVGWLRLLELPTNFVDK